jgi:hypothetical protein
VALLIDHQSINVQAGTRDFGPVVIPDSLTKVTITLARMTTATPTFWAPGVSMSLDAEVSFDGGATWRDLFGWADAGGITQSRTGGELANDVSSTVLPPGAGRRIRFHLVVAGGTLVSQLTVEVV